MKLVFVSNYFNHQQMPLCERLYSHLGKDFIFLATKPMREERKKLGYGMDSLPEYVICAYDIEKDREMCLELVDQADVVIFGSAPESLIKDRIKKSKIVIRYSERPLKNGFSYLKYLPRFLKWHSENPYNKPVYMLCASAYTAYDYSRFFLFKNRMFKWGYFPEVKNHNTDELLSQKEEKTILWCGRFIDWKHPDDVLIMAKKLTDSGKEFKVKFIGTGEMESILSDKCKELNLEDRVELLGSMPPSEVRKNMEKAQIYVATSDFKEGWGAVVNEAMSSCCAVVASHAMGSVPFLIKNNENGLIYESGNVEELTKKVGYLLDNSDECKRIGKNAYASIADTWNAKTAADRLLTLISGIIEGKDMSFPDGPCSRSAVIKNCWLNRM